MNIRAGMIRNLLGKLKIYETVKGLNGPSSVNAEIFVPQKVVMLSKRRPSLLMADPCLETPDGQSPDKRPLLAEIHQERAVLVGQPSQSPVEVLRRSIVPPTGET